MTDNNLMALAWRDFIVWAASNPEVRARFTAETGIAWPKNAASPIERMVDVATGYEASAMRRFVHWATEELWGLEEAPASLRAEIEASRTGEIVRPR